MKLKALYNTKTIPNLIKSLHLAKVPDISTSAKLLMEHSVAKCKMTQTSIASRHSSFLGRVYRKVTKLLKLRRLHVPIQYLIGQWQFRKLRIKIRPPILIPRYETEFMVEIAIQEIKRMWPKGSQLSLVDLGCGSGVIGLSVIKQLAQYKFKGTFLDLSAQCLNLTRQNAIFNKIDTANLSFVLGDMSKRLDLIHSAHIILSNPPYLPQNTYRKLQKQVKLYQSKTALLGGANGLSFIEAIVNEINRKQSSKFISVLEYGGEDLKHLSVQQSVRVDQYGKRRFIVLHSK